MTFVQPTYFPEEFGFRKGMTHNFIRRLAIRWKTIIPTMTIFLSRMHVSIPA